jgi:hypothetical protein
VKRYGRARKYSGFEKKDYTRDSTLAQVVEAKKELVEAVRSGMLAMLKVEGAATVFSTHSVKELPMKSFTPSSSCWATTAKAGLMLAFVLGQMPVHAAKKEATVAPADDMAPVIVSNEPVKLPPKHRKVTLAPVKHETPPSKPQQPVRALR